MKYMRTFTAAAVVLIIAVISVAVLKINGVETENPVGGLQINPREIEGAWVEPVPGSPEEMQGFELHADGSAKSINMATLIYKTWKISDGRLIMTYQSVGNGVTIDDDTTFTVEFVDRLTLKLIDEHGGRFEFHRFSK